MNKAISAIEPMSIVTQTAHEKVIEKTEKDRLLELNETKEKHLLMLEGHFLSLFMRVSRTIFGHKYRSWEWNGFCDHFSAEERLALEKSMRKHPAFKARMAIFFLTITSSFGVLVANLHNFLPILSVVLVMIPPCACIYLAWSDAVDKIFLQMVRIFLLRRKLIRLGGPKAPEDAIREMREICERCGEIHNSTKPWYLDC